MNGSIEQELIQLINTGDYESAIQLVETHDHLISSPTPGEASIMTTLLILIGETDECIKYGEFHIKNIVHVDLFYNLAYAYEISGNRILALKNYQCAKLVCMESDARDEINEKILQLRYNNVHEEEFQLIKQYLAEEKLYIKDQLLNPNTDVDPSEYITIEKPNTLKEIDADNKLKILYAPIEIANHMAQYLDYFRKKEYEVFGINYYPSYLGYTCDLSIDISKLNDQDRQTYLLLNTIDLISDYDVFHFIFNRTLMPQSTDVIPLKKLGKRVFMHNLGSEIRVPEIARVHHKYWSYAEDYLSSLNGDQILHNIKAYSTWIDHCIVNDYEMRSYVEPYYKQIHMLGLPIDTEKYSYKPQVHHDPIRIVHAPTNRSVKGSVYFEKAIENLQKKYAIDYHRIEKTDHDEAMKQYGNADIVLDELIIGTYGSLTMECLSMGRCVATFINPSFQTPHNETIPVLNVTVDTVEAQLEKLILSFDLRSELSKLGRQYVERNNTLETIGAQLLKIYKSI